MQLANIYPTLKSIVCLFEIELHHRQCLLQLTVWGIAAWCNRCVSASSTIRRWWYARLITNCRALGGLVVTVVGGSKFNVAFDSLRRRGNRRSGDRRPGCGWTRSSTIYETLEEHDDKAKRNDDANNPGNDGKAGHCEVRPGRVSL